MNRKPIRLGINVDQVASIRQARGTRFPDPIFAAQIAAQAGADNITVHLREDRRHIQERDLHILKEVLLVNMNLEMAPTDEMVGIATAIKPTACCIVPERRAELTTERGIDVVANIERLRHVVAALQDADIRVSLFIDADPVQINMAKEVGADDIEIHTGFFADAKTTEIQTQQLSLITAAVDQGMELGLGVHAGHGLNYQNVQTIAAIAGISELNIGHAIIAQAVFTGLAEAVVEMRSLINGACCQ